MPGHARQSLRTVTTNPRALLGVATVVAAVATAGSLWLSLGLGRIPCRLCWYQRILMYPLVVVLGVATYEGRTAVYRTVLPLSVLGAGLAAYHSYIQIAPDSAVRCVVGCGTVQFRLVGLTVPNLSLLAFLLVTATTGVLAAGDRLS